MALDPAAIRADFPITCRKVHGGRLVYLDSAATSHKPRAVIDAITDYYERYNSNVHRGSYQLAVEATEAMELARNKVAQFIGASRDSEVIFATNATEALTWWPAWGPGQIWGRVIRVVNRVRSTTPNIVPCNADPEQGHRAALGSHRRQRPLDLTDPTACSTGPAAERGGSFPRAGAPATPSGQRPTPPHEAGALMVVGRQPYTRTCPTDVAGGGRLRGLHRPQDVRPNGSGVLWAKSELLETMPPFLGGGEMILNVTKEGFSTAAVPWKFEAGTPPIAEAVGLGAAVDYLNGLGMEQIREHEVALTGYALRTLNQRYGDDITIHGPTEPAERGGVLSFEYKGIHPHDVAQVLDRSGVCVRAGHHCAKPLMRVLGCAATSRASMYVYNDESDVDALADALGDADAFFIE